MPKIKRKGAYQYEDLGWHTDQGGLVIRKAAEASMVYERDIREFITSHTDVMDFMMRVKVPRAARLELRMPDGTIIQQQNICRYYACKSGGQLVKILPPLASSESKEPREQMIDAGWMVRTCNNMIDFEHDIDYDYYVTEAEKLIITN